MVLESTTVRLKFQYLFPAYLVFFSVDGSFYPTVSLTTVVFTLIPVIMLFPSPIQILMFVLV